MSLFAFILIVTSATFHASWNMLAKKHRMTLPFLAVLCVVSALLAANIFIWTPVPVLRLPWKFWGALLFTLIGDTIYWIGLMMAYRLMDMSSAYPMMRALPILLTAGVTWVFGLGQTLTPLAVCGIVLIFLGCMSIPLKSYKEWNWRTYFGKSMFFILVTAAGTTWYTVMDNQSQKILIEILKGSEISTPIISVTYYAIRELFLAIGVCIPCLLVSSQRIQLKTIWKDYRWAPVFAGIFASLTYGLVIVAMNYVDNVSYVQVFRQLGLLIGMGGAIFILKEKATLPKIIGGLLIVSGLILSVLKI